MVIRVTRFFSATLVSFFGVIGGTQAADNWAATWAAAQQGCVRGADRAGRAVGARRVSGLGLLPAARRHPLRVAQGRGERPDVPHGDAA